MHEVPKKITKITKKSEISLVTKNIHGRNILKIFHCISCLNFHGQIHLQMRSPHPFMGPADLRGGVVEFKQKLG